MTTMPKRRKEYDPVFVERVKELYASGLSYVDVADAIGSTRNKVERMMNALKLPRRTCGARSELRRKERNPNSYYACHKRVRRVRGTPKRCEVCKTRSTKKLYDWANMTGKLDDPFDYVRMCRQCHVRHDKGVKRVDTNHALRLEA